ncbi:MAG: MscS family membrane protein [Myxococcota bacterium]|jgi:MscS family membrane protein
MHDVIAWFEQPWARALAQMAIALVAALVVNRFVVRGLLVLSGRTATDIDDKLVEFLKRPLVISIILVGAYSAVAVLGLSAGVHYVTVGILQTVAVLVWSGAILTAMRRLSDHVSRTGTKLGLLQLRTVPIFDMSSKLVVFLVAAYFTFLAWNIDVTAWLASAGVVGIAVGFAAKDTLANLFAGIFILADAPYKLGDTIRLEEGTRGVVTDIGMRSTRVLTRDEIEITLPNALIANGKIANESGGPRVRSRIRLPCGVAYGSDVEQVRQLLVTVATGISAVCNSPRPRARFMELADSALLFSLDVFIDDPAIRDDVIDSLNTRIYAALNEARISIPFPQRDVHLISSEPGPA